MTTQFAPIWNNAAITQTCIRANVTDLASAVGSTVVDLGINGVSIFSLNKNNNIIIKETTPTTPPAGYISIYAQNGQLNVANSSGLVSSLPRITSGTDEPTGGTNGDIYLQYS